MLFSFFCSNFEVFKSTHYNSVEHYNIYTLEKRCNARKLYCTESRWESQIRIKSVGYKVFEMILGMILTKYWHISHDATIRFYTKHAKHLTF